MKIGKIVEVMGTRVKAIIYEKMPPYLLYNTNIISAPQINTYVKTRIGLNTIICQIIGEYLKLDNKESKEIGYFIELEVKGRIQNKKFLGGLRLLPFVDADVETLENEDFEILFSKPEFAITIGTNLFDDFNKITLDINKLIPSHIGIFGNTGSGKSNTMAKILKEYLDVAKSYPNKVNSKILIFDLNNEYGHNAICNCNDKKVYNLTTRKGNGDKIPFRYNKITAEDWGIILNATEKTQLPIIKKALENRKQDISQIPNYGIDLIKRLLLNPSVANAQMFFSLRTYLYQYYSNIDDIKFNKTTGSFYFYNNGSNIYIRNENDISSITLNIDDNELNRFEFELLLEIIKRSESGINFEYISPLIHRMANKKKELEKVFINNTTEEVFENILFDNKQVCVIQLGRVNREVREMLPSLLSNIFLDARIELRNSTKIDNILNIVIDEAHNLLCKQEEQSEIHSNNLKTFEKIIKEGRKFGLFLMIASQRPSDISNTITSQIHNYFIHKLVNPNDIEKIRKTVAYMNESSLNMLTVLGKGECIISGTALYMPQYVYVDELNKESKPDSEDITILGENGIIE